MGLQGKDGGTYKNAAAVYGKSGGSWLYAKEAFAKNAGVWQRAWTDCRLFDAAGGRDWSAPTSVVTYTGTCGNRTETTTVTRTKTGCPNDVRATTISSPNCEAGCFDGSSTTANIYSGTCASRTYVVRTTTTYTAKAGSNCTTYSTSSDGSPIASPTCDGACTTADTAEFSVDGQSFYYTGTPGYFAALIEEIAYKGCTACGPGYYRYVTFYVTTCNGTRTITATDCDVCFCFFC